MKIKKQQQKETKQNKSPSQKHLEYNLTSYLGQYLDLANLTHEMNHPNGVLFGNKKEWAMGTHNNWERSKGNTAE